MLRVRHRNPRPEATGLLGVSSGTVSWGMFQMDRSVWPGRLKAEKDSASLRHPHRRCGSQSSSASSERAGDLCGGDTP